MACKTGIAALSVAIPCASQKLLMCMIWAVHKTGPWLSCRIVFLLGLLVGFEVPAYIFILGLLESFEVSAYIFVLGLPSDSVNFEVPAHNVILAWWALRCLRTNSILVSRWALRCLRTTSAGRL